MVESPLSSICHSRREGGVHPQRVRKVRIGPTYPLQTLWMNLCRGIDTLDLAKLKNNRGRPQGSNMVEIISLAQ